VETVGEVAAVERGAEKAVAEQVEAEQAVVGREAVERGAEALGVEEMVVVGEGEGETGAVEMVEEDARAMVVGLVRIQLVVRGGEEEATEVV
jgi:hypothetical protein